MLSRIKSYFGDLGRHWVITTVFVVFVALFLSPWISKAYEAVRARVPFLPASKYGA